MTYYGTFERYTPEDEDARVLFFKSDDGVDWFTFTRSICQWNDNGKLLSTSTGEKFISVDPKNNEIKMVNFDLSTLVPDGLAVYGLPANTEVEVGQLFVNGVVKDVPVVVPVAITYKTDVWKRMSDEQCDIFDTQLTLLSTKQRNLWMDCQYLSHDDEFFSTLTQAVTAFFGADECARILAPSKG